MLVRLSRAGKIIHIDFGDCFEVATLREKFAEKVPFRLTKILINAMDVSGTEGTWLCHFLLFSLFLVLVYFQFVLLPPIIPTLLTLQACSGSRARV
jgi:phosphatidylinositol kinase/protein kinase (PI-3  family)